MMAMAVLMGSGNVCHVVSMVARLGSIGVVEFGRAVSFSMNDSENFSKSFSVNFSISFLTSFSAVFSLAVSFSVSDSLSVSQVFDFSVSVCDEQRTFNA